MTQEKKIVTVDKQKLMILTTGLVLGFALVIYLMFPYIFPDKEIKEELIGEQTILKIIGEKSNIGEPRKISLSTAEYSDNDMVIEFDDSILKEDNILRMELKSHKTVNEIKEVSVGNQVVMWYDFNSVYGLERGLGTPEFTDMNTGELISREWNYVYWSEEQVWNEVNKTYDTIEKWKPYSTKDIPLGNIRIGIQVEVKPHDYVDGVWIIGGEKINRHALWTDTDKESHDREMVIHIPIGDGVNYQNGVMFFSNTTKYIVNATINLTSLTNPPTTCWLNRTDTDVITNASVYNVSVAITKIVGDTCPLGVQLLDGVPYLLVANSNGSAYDYWYAGYTAKQDTYIYWGGGWFNTSRITNYMVFTSLFVGNTSGDLTVLMGKPVNYFNTTNDTIRFESGTIYNSVGVVVKNITYWRNGVEEWTDTVVSEGMNYLNDHTAGVTEGNYNWTITAFDNNSVSYNATNGTFYYTVDRTAPTLNISYPNQTFNYYENYQNLSVNWTISDSLTGLDKCWYDYGGVNTTVTCGNNYTYLNITNSSATSLTFYANDTASNLVSQTVTWSYRLFKNWEIYETSVLTGVLTTFTLNANTNGSDVTVAYLNYNNTNYLGTITEPTTNNFTITRTLTSEAVTASTNISFFWNITQGSLNYIFSSKNQTVNTLSIDNCSTNTVNLYNFTIKDEVNQGVLSAGGNDTLGRVDLQMYTIGTDDLVVQYNKTFSEVNPFRICINNSLSTGQSYNIDVLVEYSAKDYQTEFYNLQNETITNASLNTNISLYDLNSTFAQSFKLIVRDDNYLKLKDALVEVHRKYLDEGVYKIVEIPKTDDRGETVSSLVLNDVIYKFVVKKYGVTLSTFDNVRAVCQTPLVTECSIDFNAFSTGIELPDFETMDDFNFTLDYNETSRVISTQFVIPTGAPSTIQLIVKQQDALGTSVCTDTLTSSSGTLSCIIPNNFGNSTVTAKLYKDGSLQATSKPVKLDQNASDIYGSIMVLLGLFVMLTLIGASISDNPVFTVIFFIVGFGLLYSINLIDGAIGAGSTILFLIIAVVIVIIKGANRS